MIDDVELFRCYLCQRFRPMDKDHHKLVRFKDLIMPKDICNECYDRALKEGMMGGGRDPILPPKTGAAK